MDHHNRECPILIFRYRWQEYWPGDYQEMSSREKIFSNIDFQAFPPATVVFTGIGVLLSVGILHLSLLPILIPRLPRWLKMQALAKTSLLRPSTALNISSTDLRYTLTSHRLWQ